MVSINPPFNASAGMTPRSSMGCQHMAYQPSDAAPPPHGMGPDERLATKRLHDRLGCLDPDGCEQDRQIDARGAKRGELVPAARFGPQQTHRIQQSVAQCSGSSPLLRLGCFLCKTAGQEERWTQGKVVNNPRFWRTAARSTSRSSPRQVGRPSVIASQPVTAGGAGGGLIGRLARSFSAAGRTASTLARHAKLAQQCKRFR
jgi:hypothetical protein